MASKFVKVDIFLRFTPLLG